MNENEQISHAYSLLPHFQRTDLNVKKNHLLYQYRTFNSFWEIIKSDSLWATNARFSNDEAEQQFGKEIIASLCKDKIDTDALGLDENFIICFCKEDDKLSQWRGYAAEGGVSMGFDFSTPTAFSIIKSDSSTNEKKALKKSNCVVQYVGVDEVRYIEPKTEITGNYSEYCQKKLMLPSIANNDDEKEIYRKEIQQKAPYIKHNGFAEEEECRLVFRNNNGELNAGIRYRDSDSKLLRYPYIVVKSARPGASENRCSIRVCLPDELEIKVANELTKIFKGVRSSVAVHGCHMLKGYGQDAKSSFCAGCTLRHFKGNNTPELCRFKVDKNVLNFKYALPKNQNCIIISEGKNQQEVFEIVHDCVQKYVTAERKISVWCEGHLPLRKITVGPSINQSSVVEAIKHYCKHTYWLRDVEIVASSIPFRRSL